MAQARDWRGRWTSGGGGAIVKVSSSDAGTVKWSPTDNTDFRARTIDAIARNSPRPVGAPISRDGSLRAVRPKVRTVGGQRTGSIATRGTRGSGRDRRAARRLTGGKQAKAGTYLVSYGPQV